MSTITSAQFGRWIATLTLLVALLVASVAASPFPQNDSLTLRKRGNGLNYTDPNDADGGQMLTIIPGSTTVGLGEPLNVIVSGLSDASVLTVEGFLLWATSINFGVSCLGQANGTSQYANLGTGAGNVSQGTGDGDNGVLRYNYLNAYFGTCKETLDGGNHFRWWQQENTDAYFLASSVELDLATGHNIASNGYNLGRDYLVGNATISNGTQWSGNVYQTTVEYVAAGILLNATSVGVNHPDVALTGQPAQDGRVAVLTVRQLNSSL
ncbi:hypothetical protein CBS101457_003192 [Exobasidium rhododendri]|nr:hypothetical protein CBS101457_003192 [Exobasidium rhododendri]